MKPRKFKAWAVVPRVNQLSYASLQGLYPSRKEALATLQYNFDRTEADQHKVVEVELIELRGVE